VPGALGLKDIMYLKDAKGTLRSNEMSGMDLKTLRSLRISILNPKHLAGLKRIKKMFTDIMTMSEDEIGKLSATPSTEFVDRYGPFPGMFRTYFFAPMRRLRLK
jgi:hypothetical protein